MARSVIALAVFLLVFAEKGKACDACGCSVNGVGVGLMAAYRQNYIGIQYQYAPFSSKLVHAQGAVDEFHTFELAARYRLWRRLSLQLMQAWRLNNRQHPDGDASLNGLGDTRLLANFAVLNQLPLGNEFRLYAEVGAGTKAPTGKFDPNLHNEQNLPENFNPGNGSWAYLLQSNLVLSRKGAGLALSGSYQHNLPSEGGYRFGGQWSGQALLFNEFPLPGRLSVTPYGGFSIEKVAQDEKADGKYAPSTGGRGCFAAAGLNLKFDNWLLGAALSQPFSQHYSNAEVEAKGRLTVQVSHIF